MKRNYGMAMVPYQPRIVAVRAGGSVMAPYRAPRKAFGGRAYSGRYYTKLRWGNRFPLNRRAVSSPETGFVDLALAGYGGDTTGSIVLAATVAQGASVNQRVGKKIMWKSMQIRGSVFANTTTTLVSPAWLLVYDRRPTGSLPAITDVLVSASSNSFNNDANSGRFKIVRRCDYALSGNSTTPASGNETADINEFVSLKGLQGVFKAAGTGAIGDIEQGALYFITVGDVAAGTAASTIGVALRTRFVDI